MMNYAKSSKTTLQNEKG